MTGPFPFRPRFLLFLAAACLLTVPAPAKAPKAKMLDLTDTVLSNRIMTQFALMVRGSDLASFLSSRGPFTLFAPTDSAFSRLAPGEMEALLRPENQQVLQEILLYHVVNGSRFSSKDLLKQKSLPSCEGAPIPLRTSRSGAQFVGKAKILRADIRCENGLMHEIDTVLIPPGVKLPAPIPPGAPDAAADTNAPSAAPASPSTNAATTNLAPEPETNTPPVHVPATNAPSLAPPLAPPAETNAAPRA